MTILTKIPWFCFFLAFPLSAWAQNQKTLPASSEMDQDTYTGIISEEHPNGTPSLWREVSHGKAEGLWLEWYPDGTLRYRAYWSDDMGNGKWEYFHPNGELESVSYYVDDMAEGIYRSYFNSGQIKSDACYHKGKKHGTEFIYDADGLLISQKRFQHGSEIEDGPSTHNEESSEKLVSE